MIIFLNGTSSSGKSSVAKALLKRLDKPFFYFSTDRFLQSSMPTKINFEIPEELNIIDRSISGFNKALGCYAQHIEHMIIDHVLQKTQWLHEVSNSLKNTDVCFVGVTAPLETIEERERKREDRQPGTARAQYDQINSYNYDITVDTSKHSPDLCAELILKKMNPGNALHQSSSKLLSLDHSIKKPLK